MARSKDKGNPNGATSKTKADEQAVKKVKKSKKENR